MADLIKVFFSGIFLFNAIPHLVQGICGKRHMTPFSQKSSPTINVMWGWINLLIGGCLFINLDAEILAGSTITAFLLGGFLISLILSMFWSNPNAKLPWHNN
ncbi:MAG: hypothetical protein WA081_09300 [Desulfosalsimonadaceae bacterium]|nr:MAG: hypothetical protein C4518_03955 [Desulfobacteraceae bacterium]